MKNSELKISTAALSDVGAVRKANEDSYFVSKDERLLIVCDGMGGQVAGGLASKIAVETVKDIFFGLKEDQILKISSDLDPTLAISSRRLISAVRMANRRLFSIAARIPKLRGMGTTVVAATFDEYFATMVHVGDSRIFRYSDGEVVQLTEDHSWLNELIEDNELNEEEIETFQQKNVITRALGTSPTVKVDIHCEKYKKNDVYILCTDGMHASVSGEDISKMISNHPHSLETITKKLIEKAKRRDGTDNITAALAQIRQNSAETKMVGTSATITEEDEKVALKEDKFILEKYGSTKLSITNKTHVLNMMHQRFIFAAAVLVTAVFCFLLGMNLQPAHQPLGTAIQPNVSGGQNPGGAGTSEQTAQAASFANGQQPVSAAPPVIQRSAVSRDAVLAVVFFNSQRDYDAAQLEERAKVLDQLSPLSKEGHELIQGTFSIFLIDSSNNVIRKTSGVHLPDVSPLP
ncbi:MAG TPA: Stp1/IreP family PP2C-type Ser/Thr phosphatase [bacterium]